MTLDEMKRIKQERGYTMAQLSEYSGVPLGTLQKIFTGETAYPRYATRQAIERVLAGEETIPSGGTVSAKSEHKPAAYGDGEKQKTTQTMCVRESANAYGAQRGKSQGEYTVADYYTLPDERRAELIDGVIYDMSAPGFVHQRIAGKMFSYVDAYIQKKGGNCIPAIAPVDVRLDCDDKTMIQPDLVIVCDRNKIKRWGIMGAPEFVLEVVSNSTRKMDYTKKLQKYAEAGVKEYWIIDPEKKILMVYDFVNENMPCIYPLEGKAGLALYNGDLQIDLKEIADLIQDWPE